jgi:hypothetical protein
MTAVTSASSGGRVFPVLTAVPTLAVLAAAAVLASSGQRELAISSLLAAVVAAGLSLHVDLPWGGRLTLGHAVLIALVVRADPLEAALVAAAGVALALPAWLHQDDEGPLVVRLGGAAAVLAGSMAAVLARVLVVDDVTPAGVDRDVLTVVHAALVGVAFLGVDHLGRTIAGRHSDSRERPDLRQAWPLYVTILCVAALIDVALRRSVALALVATVPLIVTRYTFQRYTTARRTYEQTTLALSLLPEVAGLTPLGHGERTAVYASAVGAELGFDADRCRRIATAARLHHIGHISLHEPEERQGPPDPAELAAVSGEILRETGFLADLADVVGDAQPGGAPTTTLDGAVVRVCSTLDDLLESGDGGGAIDPFADLVALYSAGHERTAAVALLALHTRRPHLVDEARGAAAALTAAAAASGSSGHDHDH